MVDHLIITIDGTSSTGKSTISKRLAKKFKCLYIDSGAMYRALTLYCLEKNIISEDFFNENLIKKELKKVKIDFLKNPKSKNLEIVLNGSFVERKIRSLDVSQFVSKIAKVDIVRSYIVKLQHSFGCNRSVIMDGRDIGTVVFPDAKYKFFLEASLEIRSKRRFNELSILNKNLKFDDVKKNIMLRDQEDMNRLNSPLKKADDSILINTDNLNLDQLEKKIISFIKI